MLAVVGSNSHESPIGRVASFVEVVVVSEGVIEAPGGSHEKEKREDQEFS